MTKQSGIGDNFYVGGYNLSGDTASLEKISTSQTVLNTTGIDKSAYERIGAIRDGSMAWTSFFNNATSQAHPALATIPTTDVTLTYARGTAIGNAGACMVAKRLNYDGTRATDGGLLFKCEALANGYGLEWGVQLTDGLHTSVGIESLSGVSGAVSSVFGAQAYLQVTAFTGTDVTVKLQDSADNASFADLAGGGFTQITTAPQTQRIALASNATVRQYVRATLTTSGGFSLLKFSVVFVKNLAAVSF